MSYFVVTHRALRGGPLSSVTNTATTITSPSYTTPRDSIPWLADRRVDPGQAGVGEGLVSDGNPQPMQYPSQTIVGFERAPVAVGSQRFDPGQNGVEFE